MVNVSVLIPAYNEEKYISESVNSVLNQDFEDFELLIINDCSKDKTQEIVEKLAEKDERIKPINLKENKGRSGALNVGIDNSDGEYIAILDADDLMEKGRLNKQVDFLEDKQEIDMVYGDMKIMGENGKIEIRESIEYDIDPKKLLVEASKRKDSEEMPHRWIDKKERKFIPSSSVMIRKKVFEKCRFDENLRNSEDYDMWFQIIGRGFKIAKIKDIMYIYREHPGQKSRNKKKMKIANDYIEKKLKGGKYFK